VRYYIDHPNEAEAIARAGRARAEKEHTWEKRFEKLLKTIGLLER
jgi:spore maturation protein CgeB